LDELERIRGRREHLREEIVRVERDRRDERDELVGRERLLRRRGRRRRLREESALAGDQEHRAEDRK
jgi:hypothetical protein